MKRGGFLKRSQPLRRSSNKYGNVKCYFDGIRFDSLIERDHYLEFQLLQKAGEISEYEFQRPFPLHVLGVRIGNIEPDHFYFDHSIKCFVVSDTKSPKSMTPLWKWKFKHMQTEYPQYVYEIRLKNKTNRYFPKRDQEIEDYQK